MSIVKKTCCVLLPLSFTKSFKMKICCVLLPASLWRRYSCVLLSSSAVYFYQCVYQKLCLRCQVPSREGLYEWDILPIKIKKKKKKKMWIFSNVGKKIVDIFYFLARRGQMSSERYCHTPGVVVVVVVVVIGVDNFRLKFLFFSLSQVKVSVY